MPVAASACAPVALSCDVVRAWRRPRRPVRRSRLANARSERDASSRLVGAPNIGQYWKHPDRQSQVEDHCVQLRNLVAGPQTARRRPVADPLPRALCLSGGGYRAMLFHAGALWRMNEARLLPTIDLISSVSGGSITAGVLGMRWSELAFDESGFAKRFDLVADDLHRVADSTIDVRAVLAGVLGPGSIGDKVAASYRRQLFGGRTLQDLPDQPRFVFCATSLQTGSLWRFSKRYMADYRIGVVPKPQALLAVTVAASSAFPPFLSPVRLPLDASAFELERRGELHVEPYINRAVLSDGGVYDNLGLEPAWGRSTTIFASDGGGHMADQKRPKSFWPLHLLRVAGVVDNRCARYASAS